MAVDFMSMSDEEVLAMDPSVAFASASSDAGSAPGTTNEQDAKPDTQGDQDGQTTLQVDAADDQGDEAAAQAEGEGAADAGDAGQGEGTEEEKAQASQADQAKDQAKSEGEASKAQDEIDYKAQYERLMAPFQANGRTIKADTVEEAIQLMQMGAGFSKKMASLKPHLKLMKMLENNGLLDENKLSFLIDLDKRSPEAISKLIADSKLDPMDLDADKAVAYKPTNHSVNDQEVELDQTLDDLKGSSTFQRTIQVVTQEWDAATKQTIAGNPQLLRVLDSHMQSGVYDIIASEMEKQRLLGRLQGVSDIEAYRQVGDSINARNGFAHLVPANTQGQQTQVPAKTVVVPNPKKADDKLNEKRRAAAGAAKPSGTGKPAQDFNPLALSDEEFLKLPTKF